VLRRSGGVARRWAERAHDEAAIAWARVGWARSGAEYEDIASRARSAMPYLHRVGNLDQLARVCGTAAYAAIAERRYREALAWLDEAFDAARQLDPPPPAPTDARSPRQSHGPGSAL
jgi:hypothetical protein